MPSRELIDAYKGLLASEGLDQTFLDEESWARILRMSDDVNDTRYSRNERRSAAAIDSLARELAQAGGFWNLRIQRLVPTVVKLTEDCLQQIPTRGGAVPQLPPESMIFFGEFPTGEFNAQVLPESAGYLVLINSGLAQLLSEMTEILSEARQARLNPASRRAAVRRACRFVVAVCRKYLSGSAFIAITDEQEDHPIPDMVDRVVKDWMLRASLVFVVAHEISHIVLHHCDGGNLMVHSEHTRTTPRLEWNIELSADALALLIVEKWAATELLRKMEEEGVAEEWAGLLWDLAIYAPIFFFECERFLDATSGDSASQRRAERTHPPAAMRQRALVDLERSKSPTHRQSILQTNWYRVFTRSVRSALAELRDQGEAAGSVTTVQGDVEEFQRYIMEKAKELGFTPGE